MSQRLYRVQDCLYRVLGRSRGVLVQWYTNYGLCRRSRLIPRVFCLQGSGWECIFKGFC